MELLLWLQTIAFFAQVFDMARAQLGFSTWMVVISKMLNLSDSNDNFYIFNFHLIYEFCKDYNNSFFFDLTEKMNGAFVSEKFRQKCPVQNHLHIWRNHKIMHTQLQSKSLFSLLCALYALISRRPIYHCTRAHGEATLHTD